MNVKDGWSGLSREGSSRVGIFRATVNVHCFTLECHYQTGRRINVLTPKYSPKYNSVINEMEPEDPSGD